MNATLKKKGGINLIDSQTGVSAFFQAYDPITFKKHGQ
jgi:hypothetical protein